MADQFLDENTFDQLRNLESQSIDHRVRVELHNSLLLWFRKGLAKRVKEEDRKKTRDRATSIRQATIGRDFAMALSVFQQDISNMSPEEGYALEQKLYRTIYDENNTESLVNCLGKSRSDEVFRTYMVGSVGGLTLVNLLKKSFPGNSFKFSEIVAAPEVDVRRSVDFVLRLGDNSEGREIVRLIQLKVRNNIIKPRIYRLGKEKIEGVYNSSGLTDEYSWIIKHGTDLERFSGGKVKAYCFSVILPDLQTEVVGSKVFGNIRSSETISEFRQEALVSGLLPRI